MNLSPKKPFTPVYNKNEDKGFKKGPPVDWKLYELDMDKLLPFGKYSGRTLGYVKEIDDWYFSWMEEKAVFGDWGLVKLRKEPQKLNNEQYNPSVSETWSYMYGIDKNGNYILPE